MVKRVVINFHQEDPSSSVYLNLEILDDNSRLAKFRSQLSSLSTINRLYADWKLLYSSLNYQNRLKAPLEQVTNVSTQELKDVSLKLKHELNLWLKSENFRFAREALLRKISEAEELEIIIETEHSEIQQIPWYLWDLFEYYPKAEVALSIPIYEKNNLISSFRSSIRILAVLGNSEGIDIETDKRLLQELPNAEIKFLVEPNLQQLSHSLWDSQGWDILFFAGHGKNNQISINKKDALTIQQLRSALKKAIQRGLKIAIFNSCDGLALAKDLADLNIPQVIVMREPVPDRVAQEFLKYFLEAFSRNESLYMSVREAREKLEVLEEEFPGASWLPVLCHNPAESTLTWQELLLRNMPTTTENIEFPLPIEILNNFQDFINNLSNPKEMVVSCPICYYENVRTVVFCEACGAELRQQGQRY